MSFPKSISLTLVFLSTLLFLGLPSVLGQPAEGSIQEKVRQAKHGTDLAGKDGPMSKVSSDLIYLYHESQQTPSRKNTFDQRRGLQIKNGYVSIDALATESGEALRADLTALGLQDEAVADRLVSGRLPIDVLEEAASLGSLHSLQASAGGSGAGSVSSEGDVSMHTDQVRSNQGVDGSGVKSACSPTATTIQLAQ